MQILFLEALKGIKSFQEQVIIGFQNFVNALGLYFFVRKFKRVFLVKSLEVGALQVRRNHNLLGLGVEDFYYGKRECALDFFSLETVLSYVVLQQLEPRLALDCEVDLVLRLLEQLNLLDRLTELGWCLNRLYTTVAATGLDLEIRAFRALAFLRCNGKEARLETVGRLISRGKGDGHECEEKGFELDAKEFRRPLFVALEEKDAARSQQQDGERQRSLRNEVGGP